MITDIFDYNMSNVQLMNNERLIRLYTSNSMNEIAVIATSGEINKPDFAETLQAKLWKKYGFYNYAQLVGYEDISNLYEGVYDEANKR